MLEDVDFGYAIPRADCLRRYDDLYRAVVRVRGGDALLGRHLAKMLTDAGLVDIHQRVQLTLAEGESRRLTSMTLSGIAGSILKEGLAEEQELNRLYNDIYQLENDPDVEIGVAPTYQVWGRIPT